MRGLDYRWVEALDEIIAQRSFEKAAEVLCVSQSAVSQRIKQLEKWLAQPVLVREQPPRVTPAGQKLLGLYRQVRVLEQDVLPELSNESRGKPVSVSVATNADSLATWVLPAVSPLLEQGALEINLLVDDESRTIEKLKNGEVVGAISLASKALPGCNAVLLGNMPYLCVSTPKFYQKHFSNGISIESLQKAPAIAFDLQDFINERFVSRHFGGDFSYEVKHTVGSSEAFVKAALAGIGYGLIPEVQIREELRDGRLINITPDLVMDQLLYWHHWQLESGVVKALTNTITQYTSQYLQQD